MRGFDGMLAGRFDGLLAVEILAGRFDGLTSFIVCRLFSLTDWERYFDRLLIVEILFVDMDC